MESYIQKLTEGKNLTIEESENAVIDIFNESTEAQIGALLTALKIKGETIDELAGFARGMKKAANLIYPKVSGTLVDTCGTGGDRHNTINISTASSIIASASGVTVAKHGNHSVTSLSGSADVLSELGIMTDQTPDEVCNCIENVGFGFMLAPVFHPSMKKVAPIRKSLGMQTIFNILGPLTNPAGANSQIIGVYDKKLCKPMALTLKKLGIKHALVVHGEGMDEISNIAETYVAELKDGMIHTYTLTPEDFGFKRAGPHEIVGGTPGENAQDILYILNGEKGPKRDIVVLNTAAALYVGGVAGSINEGVSIVEETIDSGKALKKLDEFRSFQKANSGSTNETCNTYQNLRYEIH
ncbi:anthranilate phosphoribosyltransferase [Methanohalobium evestigatum Z-7303]|uniref:Anthranilate phosphoribosyltransferase n=1 Tax=Methanohalobium evestigatum (strain ATCC BAA-1072 / DSM 3721 / NBRC 107634 / OCM 161 / Z-7303) TaxID=644295 RepID=D7EBJ1_METEZ|nr:anthranilate phosphoribosyltransferase [Methanohalobium evestigatum]ADI74833.1 anthranilate phosphoribosyltransferase [Methanohalobium evestigatum Z-7303]